MEFCLKLGKQESSRIVTPITGCKQLVVPVLPSLKIIFRFFKFFFLKIEYFYFLKNRKTSLVSAQKRPYLKY
ncbi:hypothetical protein BpHYR1_049750 [Brachionus plicatilis]|uniref:Uncharacterized protein n=1 Tax=Brachionus plicatilis TaxID=10195 RepID=A0A3M7Q6E6_BRAPC|nr:hypothetical protein BpHYR1_049750 [Brachionus plicatilis]